MWKKLVLFLRENSKLFSMRKKEINFWKKYFKVWNENWKIFIDSSHDFVCFCTISIEFWNAFFFLLMNFSEFYIIIKKIINIFGKYSRKKFSIENILWSLRDELNLILLLFLGLRILKKKVFIFSNFSRIIKRNWIIFSDF